MGIPSFRSSNSVEHLRCISPGNRAMAVPILSQHHARPVFLRELSSLDLNREIPVD